MDLRKLEEGDFAALSEFIIDSYKEYPLAMWFEEEPSEVEAKDIFHKKIIGIGTENLVDVVMDDDGAIVGECEIARMDDGSGIVGIFVRNGYRLKSVGSSILAKAAEDAAGLGMTKLTAEVIEGNEEAMKFFLKNHFVPVGRRHVKKGGKKLEMAVLQCPISQMR